SFHLHTYTKRHLILFVTTCLPLYKHLTLGFGPSSYLIEHRNDKKNPVQVDQTVETKLRDRNKYHLFHLKSPALPDFLSNDRSYHEPTLIEVLLLPVTPWQNSLLP